MVKFTPNHEGIHSSEKKASQLRTGIPYGCEAICDPVQQKVHLVGQVYSEIMNKKSV